MKLSEHFSLEEWTVSNTAQQRGLDNTPDGAAVAALKYLAGRMELVRVAYGHPLIATNGYRAPSVNAAVGGAANSSHMTGQAVDFVDGYDRLFARWCLSNLELLQRAGLWMENPQWTVGWVHLQSRPVEGHRVFIPDRSAPRAPLLREQGGVA